jgi:hypothetical protein
MLAGLVLVLSACSQAPGGSPPVSGPSSDTSSVPPPPASTGTVPSEGTGSDPDGWEWDVASGADATVNEEPGSDDPAADADAVQAGVPSAEAVELDPTFVLDPSSAPLPEVAACDLIRPEEWGAWIEEPSPAPAELEGGAACGWTNGDDTLRMAIGTWPAGISSGVEVTTEGGTAIWIDPSPTAQSAVLILPGDGIDDLLVEVSTRDASLRASLQEMAIHFIELAAERWP